MCNGGALMLWHSKRFLCSDGSLQTRSDLCDAGTAFTSVRNASPDYSALLMDSDGRYLALVGDEKRLFFSNKHTDDNSCLWVARPTKLPGLTGCVVFQHKHTGYYLCVTE